MDLETFVFLTLQRFRGAMAAALLAHGKQPSAENLGKLSKDDPTMRDVAELFMDCDMRLDLSLAPMPRDGAE